MKTERAETQDAAAIAAGDAEYAITRLQLKHPWLSFRLAAMSCGDDIPMDLAELAVFGELAGLLEMAAESQRRFESA
jgi:hypothetical protein